ncbi:Matrixin [Tundrisphaera lichenicola]|uniref:Matrixin n=1 Tax=Tundrisphaera lichenicola TaxID=2029860 RepID=UPI003EB798EA
MSDPPFMPPGGVKVVPSGFRLAFALILFLSFPALGDDIPDAPLKPPPIDEFLVIPLRVHILSSSDQPDIDCGLTDADLKRVVGKVNGIWHQAGVHFGLEPIVREPAARQARYKAAIDAEPEDGLTPLRLLAPSDSRSGEGVDVYYIRQFAVNGVYLGNRMAFVQETAKLRPVPGGIDEPLPRVTAHELGHALGLAHRQDRTNLLASGTTGTTLNDAEVARAREKARAMPGALPLADLRKKAEESAEPEVAGRLRGWIEEVSGSIEATPTGSNSQGGA